MAIIKWDNSFSVNIEKIDKQHQTLIALNNELNEAMTQRKGKEIMGKTITSLINYTATHFKDEEEYFHKYGYPEKEGHIKEHKAFVQKVTEFKEKFEKENVTLSIDVMLFLSKWLRNHIKVVDKKYSSFFNGKGVK